MGLENNYPPVLDINIPQENISSGVPNDFFQNLQRKQNYQQSLNVDDINSYNFGLSPEEEAAYNESQKQYQPTKEVLRPTDYYPNLGDPIGVGQSSGRIIGTQTQYVPNGALVPIGMYDARDAAIQKAAMAKAKDVADWREKNTTKPPVSNLTNINDKLTKDYFDFEEGAWSSAMKEAKGDANKASYILKNNQQYQSRKKAHFDRAKMGDSIVKKIETINDSKDKGYIVYDELQKAVNNAYSIADSKSEEFPNAYKNLMSLDTVKDMNDVVNDIKKNLDTQIDAGSYINQNNPDGIIEGQWSKEYYTPEMKEAAKKQAYLHYGLDQNGNGGTSYANKTTIDSMINQALGFVKNKSDKNWQNKSKDNNGFDDQINEQDVTDESDLINVENQVKQGKGTEGVDKDYNIEQVPGSYSQQLKKPIPLKVPAGTTVYEFSGGNKNFLNTKLKGVVDMTTAKSTIIDVVDAPGTADNGRPVTVQYKERQKESGLKTKKMAVVIAEYDKPVTILQNGVNVPKNDPKGNPLTERVSVFIPAKSVANGVQKKSNGKYAGGLNVDLSVKKADDLNSGKIKQTKEYESVPYGDGKKTVAVEKGETTDNKFNTHDKQGKAKKYKGLDPSTGMPIYE